MRIGLDFDGTIADASGAKMRYARDRWGVTLTRAQSMRPEAEPLIGRERYDRMIADVFGPITLQMEPMPGAVDTLRRLAQAHELFVVTARLDHEVQYAARWLRRHAIPVREVRNARRGFKAAPCRDLGLDVLFEDSPLELAGLPADAPAAALLATPYNAHEARAAHWHEVPDWPSFEALCTHMLRLETTGAGGTARVDDDRA